MVLIPLASQTEQACEIAKPLLDSSGRAGDPQRPWGIDGAILRHTTVEDALHTLIYWHIGTKPKEAEESRGR
jgi:hypothetical protein